MDKHSAKNSGTRVPFETLIRGEYREDFQKKVEEILRRRFRERAREEARDRAGQADETPKPVPAAAAEATEKPEKSAPEPEKIDENTEYSEEIEAEAAPSPAPGENAGPAAVSQETPAAAPEEAAADPAQESRDPGDPVYARYARLVRSAELARRAYPDFDLRRELESPRFASLIFRGVDAKSAYEAAHHDEMLRAAMGYGVRRAAEKLSRARMERPAENGAEAQSAAVERPDPRSLSAAERADIRRRVLERGEKVRF